MKREIKFRAWNTACKMWQTEYSGMSLDGTILSLMPNKDYASNRDVALVFQQFTGLLDKNGKEIYEFDYLETGGTNVWWVRWGSGKYILQNISTGDIIDCDEKHTQRQEVIGNSYESPREHPAMASDL